MVLLRLFVIAWIAIGLWSEVRAVFVEQCKQCSSAPSLSSPTPASASLIVDVFVVIAKLRKYEHVTGGPFWLTLDVLHKFAKMTKVTLPVSTRHNHSQPLSLDTRIHVLTESDDIIQHAQTHLSHPYYVHDMRKYAELTASFYQTYSKTHVSVNSLDYEFLCFNRWHLFSNITETWNQQWYPQYKDFHINYILSLDLDVLMTISAADFVQRIVSALSTSAAEEQRHDFEVAVIGLGAINVFTPKGLKSFSKYIQSWYAQSDEEVRKANAKYGRFFSDMMIMKEYLEAVKTTEQRNACYEYWKASEYYSWKEDPTNKCLLERLGCVPMSGYREMMKGNTIRFYRGKEKLSDAYSLASMAKDGFGQVTARGDREELPYCLIVSIFIRLFWNLKIALIDLFVPYSTFKEESSRYGCISTASL